MHQYLFFIGDFPVRMYGLMLCTAIFMATAVAYFLAWRDGRGWEKYLPDLGIYGGFCGLIGARLWDVFFFDWGYYSQHLAEIPFVWQGGMAIQGGILGGVLGGAVYCWRHQVDWIDMLDVICPALFIGQSVGRMANLLNGDAFGAHRRRFRHIVPGRDPGPFHLWGGAPVAGGSVGRTGGCDPVRPAAAVPDHQAQKRTALLSVCDALQPAPVLPGISPGRLRGTHAVGPEKRPGNGPGVLYCGTGAVCMGGYEKKGGCEIIAP